MKMVRDLGNGSGDDGAVLDQLRQCFKVALTIARQQPTKATRKTERHIAIMTAASSFGPDHSRYSTAESMVASTRFSTSGLSSDDRLCCSGILSSVGESTSMTGSGPSSWKYYWECEREKRVKKNEVGVYSMSTTAPLRHPTWCQFDMERKCTTFSMAHCSRAIHHSFDRVEEW